MCSLKKQTDGCMCGCLANTKEHEFVVQPKCGSCGELTSEVLAGSLTGGNYVTVRDLLAGCPYADSGLGEQGER